MKNRKYSTRDDKGAISKEYRTWKGMKARCYAPSNANSGNYQKDGIIVCDRWKDSFDNFMDDMGYAPEKHYSLEREDNLKNYEPSNCKWIPVQEQAKNRSSVLYFTYEGETLILKDWARKLVIKYTTLYLRVTRNGLSFEEAVKYSNLVEIEGESKTVKEWCTIFNINYNTIIDIKFNNKHLDYKELLLSRRKD